MHLLKMLLRCINAVGCVKKRHAPRCIHKMQAIISVIAVLWNYLSDPVFDGERLAGFMSWANVFFNWTELLTLFLCSICTFLFLSISCVLRWD